MELYHQVNTENIQQPEKNITRPSIVGPEFRIPKVYAKVLYVVKEAS